MLSGQIGGFSTGTPVLPHSKTTATTETVAVGEMFDKLLQL